MIYRGADEHEQGRIETCELGPCVGIFLITESKIIMAHVDKEHDRPATLNKILALSGEKKVVSAIVIGSEDADVQTMGNTLEFAVQQIADVTLVFQRTGWASLGIDSRANLYEPSSKDDGVVRGASRAYDVLDWMRRGKGLMKSKERKFFEELYGPQKKVKALGSKWYVIKPLSRAQHPQQIMPLVRSS